MFVYEELNRSEFMGDLSQICSRVASGNKSDDYSELESTFNKIPAQLESQALLYIFEKSIEELSEGLYLFVESKGFDKCPEVLNNFLVICKIRDAYFEKWQSLRISPHWDFMLHESRGMRTPFIIDTIDSAFCDKKIKSVHEKLTIAIEMFGDELVKNARYGNQIIYNLNNEWLVINRYNHSAWRDVEKIITELNITDDKTLLELCKLRFEITSFRINFKSALIRRFKDGRVASNYDLISQGLEKDPHFTIQTILDLSEGDFSTLVYEERFVILGQNSVLNKDWLSGKQRQLAKDKDLRDMIRQLFKRVLKDPVMMRAASQCEKTGPVIAMAAPYLTTPQVLLNFEILEDFSVAILQLAGASESVSGNPLQLEVDFGYSLVRQTVEDLILEVFESLDKNHVPEKLRNEPSIEEKVSYVCIRFIAESDSVSDDWVRAEIESKPDVLEYPVFLLMCQKYSDQQKIDALEGFSHGIKRLIELDLLGVEHISLLDLNNRGDLLETNLGI